MSESWLDRIHFRALSGDARTRLASNRRIERHMTDGNMKNIRPRYLVALAIMAIACATIVVVSIRSSEETTKIGFFSDAVSKADFGKLMGAAMKNFKGQADGNIIRKTVEKLLN